VPLTPEEGDVMPQPESLTIAELQSAIAGGELTRRAVIEAHLERIERVNPITNSFVEVRADDALREAETADRERGTVLAGALDGVPTSIKDSYSVAGLHRTNGLPINADLVDAADDLVVARMRAAGALVLGHAAIPDLCIRWNTVSGLYGTTRNPRDPERTAGGSSGGDAANVAAGLATLGLGGDLGGSIRVPASFCGVYGFRPGRGRVPDVNPNPHPFDGMSDEVMCEIGPLARSVGDIETAFRVIAGFDRRDPSSTDAALTAPSGKPPVALLRHETGAVIDADIEDALDETAEMLRAEGYEVVEHVLPDLRRAPELWAEILGTELCRDYLPSVSEHVIPSARVHIEEMFGAFETGSDVTAYLARWQERRELQHALITAMERYPLVLAPVAGMRAPLLDFDDHIGRPASVALFDRMRSIPWVNLFSLPSLALPNGIQIVGRRFDELTVLAAGRAAERRLPRVEIATPAVVGAH
jgi:amidase